MPEASTGQHKGYTFTPHAWQDWSTEPGKTKHLEEQETPKLLVCFKKGKGALLHKRLAAGTCLSLLLTQQLLMFDDL